MTERLSSADAAMESLREYEDAAQAAFGNWAPGHAKGGLQVIPHDPESFPDQRFGIVHLPARPSLEVARFAGEQGMGAADYQRLVDDLKRYGVVESIETLAAQDTPASVLVATAHLENVLDTALAHNALFVASEDEDFANRNVIIANPMMKRLGLDANGAVVPVTDLLRVSGRVIFALPEEAAIKHGLPVEAAIAYRRAFAPLLAQAAKEGCAIHWALSGTRGKDIELANGAAAKMIPRVDDSIATIARKRTPYAYGVVMDLQSESPQARLLSPRWLKDTYDVHLLMLDIAAASSKLTHKKVEYGLPQGARLI